MALQRAPVSSPYEKGGSRRNRPEVFLGRALEDVLVIFVSDEAHFLDVCALRDRENLVDDLIASSSIRLQVKFRDRIHLLGYVEVLAQLLLRDRIAVPGDLIVRTDSNRVL